MRTRLNLTWRIIIILFTAVGLFFAMNQVFVWRLLGDLEYENAFIYSMFALFLSIVFIIHPVSKNIGKDRVPWYDAILFTLTFLVSCYLVLKAYEITYQGWDLLPPTHVGVMALYICLASLEAIRRVGGKILFVTCLIFALYPVFAGNMPGLLKGAEYSLWDTIIYHGLSVGSLLGLTTRIFGNLLVGFMFLGSYWWRQGVVNSSLISPWLF